MSQASSKLVADLQLVLDDRPNFCSLHVCEQLRTCLRPDNVMEFGLKREDYENCSVFCCVRQLCTMIRTHIMSYEQFLKMTAGLGLGLICVFV